MNIHVSYAELNHLIQVQSHQPISINYDGEKSVTVNYAQIPMPIRVSVESVAHPIICLSYNAGFMVNMLIPPVLNQIPLFHSPVIERYDSQNRHIAINLYQIETLQSILNKATLQNISFDTEGVAIDVLIR